MASMNESLIDEIKDEDSLKLACSKLAAQFLKEELNRDLTAGSYMKNEFTKIIFNILIKLSYGFFAIGIVLTIQSGAVDQQSVVVYLQDSRNQIILMVLVALGMLTLALLKAVKEENKLLAATKKKIHLTADINRTIFYILSLVFVGPYVYNNNDSGALLLLSFWMFVIAMAMFIGRKISKWRYFLLDKQGKTNLGPWEGKQIDTQEKLTKFGKFITLVVKKNFNLKENAGSAALSQQSNLQKVRRIQESVVKNLEEEKRLLDQINSAN